MAEDPAATAYPEFGFLINDPEVGPLLREAYAAHMPVNTFLGRLQATSWWRNNSASARNYFTLSETDPTTFQRDIQTLADSITGIAKGAGLDLSPEEIYGLAKGSMWSGRTTEADLAKAVFGSPHTAFGSASSLVDSVQQMAANYGITISAETKDTYARQLGMGWINQAQLQANMVELAKGKYPSIAALLDQGRTVKQIADPYIQQAANDLGISPDSIDINNPKWNRFLNQPTKDGVQLQTLYDWQRLYRTDPTYGYDRSPQARETAAQLTTTLAKQFGAI